MKNKGVTRDKSLAFAIRIVGLSKQLTDQKEYVISRQILRSGTAIGAMIREAEYAESAIDFIHKMAMAQKECNETLYWLELLEATNQISKETFTSLSNDTTELMKLLTASIKTKKSNLTAKPNP